MWGWVTAGLIKLAEIREVARKVPGYYKERLDDLAKSLREFAYPEKDDPAYRQPCPDDCQEQHHHWRPGFLFYAPYTDGETWPKEWIPMGAVGEVEIYQDINPTSDEVRQAIQDDYTDGLIHPPTDYELAEQRKYVLGLIEQHCTIEGTFIVCNLCNETIDWVTRHLAEKHQLDVRVLPSVRGGDELW